MFLGICFFSDMRLKIFFKKMGDSWKSPVYRLCESDSDGMKFMSQLFCVFTNSASSLLLGSNHSAPRLLLACSVEHSRSRLEYG